MVKTPLLVEEGGGCLKRESGNGDNGEARMARPTTMTTDDWVNQDCQNSRTMELGRG